MKNDEIRLDFTKRRHIDQNSLNQTEPTLTNFGKFFIFGNVFTVRID